MANTKSNRCVTKAFGIRVAVRRVTTIVSGLALACFIGVAVGAPVPGSQKPTPESLLQGTYGFAVHGHEAVSIGGGAIAYGGWMQFDGRGEVTDCYVHMTRDGELFNTDTIEDPFARTLCHGSYEIIVRPSASPSPDATRREGMLKLDFTASSFAIASQDHGIQFAMAFAEDGARIFLHLIRHTIGGREGTLVGLVPETATGEAASR